MCLFEFCTPGVVGGPRITDPRGSKKPPLPPPPNDPRITDHPPHKPPPPPLPSKHHVEHAQSNILIDQFVLQKMIQKCNFQM